MPASAQAVFDLVVRIRLEPALLRTYWSVERAWPGETIRLCAETRHVPDGTPVEFVLRSAALTEGGPVMATASGTVENSRCIVEHTVDWDDDALCELFDQGVTDCHFCLDAIVEPYALRGTSQPMYVPFEPVV